MKKLDSFPTHKTGDLEYRAGHVLPYGATPRNDHSHFISELFFYCQISAFFVEIVPDTHHNPQIAQRLFAKSGCGRFTP